MRGVLTAWLGLLLAFAALGDAAAQNWSEYRSAAGRYRVEMPGVPKLYTNPTTVQGNPASMYQAMVELRDEVYGVTYVDFPAEAVRGMNLQEALGAARDRVAADGKLVSDKPVTFGAYAAREFVVDQPDKVTTIMRAIVAGTRFYQVIVVVPIGSSTADHSQTRRFIDSFALIQP